MGSLGDKFEALLRGGADSATGGWNDEGVAALLGALPGPTDPEGISREYAAGSPEQDYRNTERADAAESQRKYPGTFGAGQLLGAAPAMALGAGAGGVAGAGLMGGLRGAASGAGHAEESDRLQGALRLAAPSALASMAGAAAPAALGKVADLFKGGPPPGGLAPAYAGAGATVGARGAEEGFPLINMMSTAPVKRGPRMGGRATPDADEEIIAHDRARWEAENPTAAAQIPPPGKQAIRPGAPPTPEEAFVPDIPKAGKTGVPSLKTGFKDLAAQDAELGADAALMGKQQNTIDKLAGQKIGPKPVNHGDPMQSRVALENDPTWRAMNEQIYGREFPPLPRNSPAWRGLDPMRGPKIGNKADAVMKAPKASRVPDLEKENQIAEDHARLLEGLDKIKKSRKGAIEKTTVKPGGLEKQTLRVSPDSVEAEEEDVRTLLGTLPL